MQSRMPAFFFASVVAGAASVQAQPAGIDHKAVACIVVAKYPKLKACFGAAVVEPRAYFHAEGVSDWYWVKMLTDVKDAPEPFCYAGILPKPSRKLIHRHVWYYLEDVGQGQRTKEYDPLVVRQARECKKDAPVAPISPTGPAGVFPVVPAGFTIGAFPTVPAVVATTVAAGTGVRAVVRAGSGGRPQAGRHVPPAGGLGPGERARRDIFRGPGRQRRTEGRQPPPNDDPDPPDDRLPAPRALAPRDDVVVRRHRRVPRAALDHRRRFRHRHAGSLPSA